MAAELWNRRREMRRARNAAAAVVVALSSLAPPTMAQPGPSRGFSVDDMLAIEGAAIKADGGARTSFSPDGRAFAFVLCRSQSASPRLNLTGWDRCDVFVQGPAGASPVNITNGAEDDSGWYNPVWSPDGRRLALASTRDGGSFWLWNAATGQLALLSRKPPAALGMAVAYWIDNRRLVLTHQGGGREHPLIATASTAEHAWRTAIAGTAPTASVLTSGSAASDALMTMAQVHLSLIDMDIDSGAVATVVSDLDWSSVGGRFAYVHRTPFSIQRDDNQMVVSAGLSELTLLDLGAATPRTVRLEGDEPVAVAGTGVSGRAFNWSRSGRSLALVALHRRSDPSLSLYFVDGESGRVTRRDVGDLRLGSDEPHWIGEDEILVRARVGPNPAAPNARRPDWWRVGRRGPITSITSQFERPPTFLLPLADRRSFAAVADGDLWRITPQTGRIENLTSGLPQLEPNYPAWPGDSQFGPVPQTYDQLVVSYRDEAGTMRWSIVDLQTGELVPLAAPTPAARFVDYSPASGDALFREDGTDGSRLWRVGARQPAELVFERNQFLRVIAPADWRRLEYTSERGQQLIGWLRLPYNYQEGRRYPLVTVPYPEDVQDPHDPYKTATPGRIGDRGFFNPELFAGQGYAVLYPSMPLSRYATPDDPYFRLTEGVMPAVDRAIEIGVADPDRLYVAGASFGGYATYGLVTQTNRFRAAIAVNGFSNILSSAGTFEGALRYTDGAHLDARSAREAFGQTRMAAPVWEDPERYFRNSPIIYAGRVETPIMMIHGDMDFVPMSQSEEFFRAMHAQGKRAEFVRYWGEGHAIESPANIRDMWRRIFDWLAQFGGLPAPAVTELEEEPFNGGAVLPETDRPLQRPQGFH